MHRLRNVLIAMAASLLWAGSAAAAAFYSDVPRDGYVTYTIQFAEAPTTDELGMHIWGNELLYSYSTTFGKTFVDIYFGDRGCVFNTLPNSCGLSFDRGSVTALVAGWGSTISVYVANTARDFDICGPDHTFLCAGTVTPVTFALYGPGEYTVISSGGGAVPEPATWAMMIVGFGMAGAALRRRRPALTTA